MTEKFEPFSRETYAKIAKVFPRIAVDGIVKDKRGVLLIHRDIYPFKGCWVIPGGCVMFKERLKPAAEREVREETGLKVKAVKYLGYYDNPNRNRNPRGRVISHAFICKAISGKLKPNFESTEVRFFKKLPKKIGFDHRKILRDAGVK